MRPGRPPGRSWMCSMLRQPAYGRSWPGCTTPRTASYACTSTASSSTRPATPVPGTPGVQRASAAAVSPAPPYRRTGPGSATNTPAYVVEHDGAAVELGLRFSSSAAGSVAALRFLKASGDTAVHTLSLWTSTGALLARATTSGETDAGWQQVRLAEPVPIEPGQTYVVSYHSETGTYAAVNAFFANCAVTSGPLTAPADDNGVYVYGATAFPAQTYEGCNYFADVVFN